MNDNASMSLDSWQDAELFAAAHIRALGYRDAVATPLGTDGGVDVHASAARGQVKHYASTPIGAPAVQRLRGATPDLVQPIFYALTGYTASAITFAKASNVALFSYGIGGIVKAENERAQELLEHKYVEVEHDFPSTVREEFIASLQHYAQRVTDASEILFRFFNVYLDRVDRTDSAMTASARLRVDGLQNELQVIEEHRLDLGHSRSRPLPDLVQSITRYEAVVRLMAVRFDLDYNEVLRVAMSAREAGELTDDSNLTRFVTQEMFEEQGLVMSLATPPKVVRREGLARLARP